MRVTPATARPAGEHGVREQRRGEIYALNAALRRAAEAEYTQLCAVGGDYAAAATGSV